MLIQIVILTSIYYITGKLGLLLALPPGYASLVWPPMGLSIAGLLLFGINRWPGVFLGAFLVNLKAFSSATEIATAAGVSCGNTIAVIFAAWLVKKILTFPKSLYTEKDIFLSLTAAGPLGALVSSTMGVGTLSFFHVLDTENIGLIWLYWFVGDATGGILFAPVALIFSSQSRAYWFKSILRVLLPLILFFGMIVTSLQYVQKAQKEKVVAEFITKSRIAFSILESNLTTYHSRLDVLRIFFENSELVTDQEFQVFANALLSPRPDIHSFIWIPASSLKTGSPSSSFRIAKQASGIQVKKDFHKDPKIRNLIERSLSEGPLIVSEAINLKEFGLNEEGLLLASSTQKPAGVILEVVRLRKSLESFKDFTSKPGYRLTVDRRVDDKAPEIVIDSLADSTLKFHSSPQLTWFSDIFAGDHFWRITFFQDPALSEDSPFITGPFLLTLLAFTFLSCAMLLIIFSRIVSIEENVREKTRDLQDLNARLEKASRTKSDFLANMSHEIRTPLNVIVGMADLLDDSKLTEEQRHYIEISRKAGHNLLSIINDILDISKIEAGLVTLEKTDVNLPSLVRDTAEMFAIKCKDKKLSLTTHIAPELHRTYVGDPTRIRQILSNLVSNAVKFTMTGGVTIKVSTNSDPTRPGNILFEVTDTGTGIPPEKVHQLFQPFTQADSTITRKFGGTGLGLSISKRLTEMMNGTIDVHSEMHVGSTFSFTLNLPLSVKTEVATISLPDSEIDASKVVEGDIQKLNILLVDDTEDNRTLIKAFLKNTPHALFESDNGENAIAFVKTHPVDLILMDMQMPVKDGFTATAEIRQWESETHRAPLQIWALTAYALKNEVNRSLEVGCNLHLVKPIRRHELLSRINELAGRKSLT